MAIASARSFTLAPLALACPPPPYWTATGLMLRRSERSSHSTPSSDSVKLTQTSTPRISAMVLTMAREMTNGSNPCARSSSPVV